MCGRYALHASPEVVALQFGLESPPSFAPRYNISPGSDALVVGDRGGALARWAMRGRLVNLRAETVLARFRRSGRCLVPASGFYEWKAEARRKQPFYFRPTSEALFALAALIEHGAFTIITTAPNETVARVHDRMPLLVPRSRYADWLAGDDALLEAPEPVPMTAHPVGTAVNEAANDSPRLIEPVELPRGLFD